VARGSEEHEPFDVAGVYWWIREVLLGSLVRGVWLLFDGQRVGV